MDTKSQDLFSALWSSADEMRKIMSADVYKDYLLGLIFYKAVSDSQLRTVVELLEERKPKDMQEAQEIYEGLKGNDGFSDVQEELKIRYGCAIEPEHTFTAFYNHINDGTFLVKELGEAFHDIEQSTIGNEGHKPYTGLFDDFDIYSKDLGKTDTERNALLSAVIKRLYALDFSSYGADALGDAYEYLIGQFASESGKKAGEFYTPQAVSKLITRIVTRGKEDKDGFTIYDPCMGSGSLLLQVKNYIGRGDSNESEGCRQHIEFFGHRFARYEQLAPKGKADLAFLLHGFYHLKPGGVMGIVQPHGVLFRGAAEGTIRKHLIEDGSIYAVIGLPANIFFNTSIPTCVIVLRKDNTSRDILFIDASQEFEKGKNQNRLTDANIDKIVSTFFERKDVDKYAHLASFEEIKKNDFNLNIARYVDTSEEEEEIDPNEVYKELQKVDAEISETNAKLNKFFEELGLEVRL